MTSYGGGYTKTSYSAQGADGGGFMPGGSQSASQDAEKKYNDSLRPVTVKQLLSGDSGHPGSAEMTIDGQPVTHFTLVGQVRQVKPQSTSVIYRIDDGTGAIDVRKWNNSDSPDQNGPVFEHDQFVRIFGRIKMVEQKLQVNSHSIRAVDDYNEVSYHLLECTYVHLCLTRGMPGAGGAGAVPGGAGTHKGGDDDSMFVNQDAGGGAAALVRKMSFNAQKVYQLLRNMPTGNEGVNINVIINELKMGYAPAMAAVQELTDSSIAYATVDDETFGLMEA